METTRFEDAAGNGSRHAANAPTEAAGNTTPFQALFDGVEDLIARLAESDSPELRKIRAKVRVALLTAKSAVSDGATQLRRQTQQVVSDTDDYVREHPWQAIGVAAVIGAAVGLLVARRR
jgi:ElaB/YqjD/DUF883 family membrane-anchored ribosome-binding protein